MSRTPHILMVAGEASGDALGGAILDALPSQHAFFGVGGPAMRSRGLNSIAPMNTLAAMGVADVARRLPDLVGLMGELVHRARKQPTVAVLIDAPDFNLRLGARLRRFGIPVVQVVAPQTWAWRQERTWSIAESCDKLLCLLPFEPAFFARFGVHAEFVGHPLAERPVRHASRGALVLLPGSRDGEIRRNLPVMTETVRAFSDTLPERVLLVRAPGQPRAKYDSAIQGLSIQVVDDLPSALAEAKLAWACSGTVTLECALTDVPTLAVYRNDWLTYEMARRLVQVPYMALPNLIWNGIIDPGHDVILPELVQGDFTPYNLWRESQTLLRRAPRQAGEHLRSQLNAQAPFGEAVASQIEEFLA